MDLVHIVPDDDDLLTAMPRDKHFFDASAPPTTINSLSVSQIPNPADAPGASASMRSVLRTFTLKPGRSSITLSRWRLGKLQARVDV